VTTKIITINHKGGGGGRERVMAGAKAREWGDLGNNDCAVGIALVNGESCPSMAILFAPGSTMAAINNQL
jgi:hypothetical protein